MDEVTRRTFLQVGGAALAAATAPGVFAGPPREPITLAPIRKAVKYGMVQEPGTVAEKLRVLHYLGFDGVEMPSPSDLDREEVRIASSNTHVPIHGVVNTAHWREPLSHPDKAVRERGRKALETALHDCKHYGGDTVLLVPAVVNKEVSYQRAYLRSQREIGKVLALAQELEVSIALENVWNNFLLSPLEAARYVDELKSEWVGWYLDVGNIVRSGWPEQWIEALGPRILKIDVKEYSRAKRDNEGLWKGFEVGIGDGDCDWPTVVAALDDLGFNGWATAEVGGGDLVRLKDIADRMDRVLHSPRRRPTQGIEQQPRRRPGTGDKQ